MAYERKLVHEYQKGAINGASPLQLIIMLYDGSLRFMEAGKRAIEVKDVDKQNLNLQKAQKIIMELMSCLDMQNGAEIAQNLLAIYGYVLNELILANCQDETEPIERCIKIMSDLRESWVTIESQMNEDHIAKAA